MLNTAASTLYRYSESPLSRQIRGSAVLRETLALRLRAGADPALLSARQQRLTGCR